MPIEYISTEDAIAAQGLRMTVVSAVPSPWGEAAKGLLYVKGLPWKAVRYNAVDKRQSDWTGYPNAPTLVHDDDKPLNGWRNIWSFWTPSLTHLSSCRMRHVKAVLNYLNFIAVKMDLDGIAGCKAFMQA